MTQESSGYGPKWKKWLAIYLIIGTIAYVVIYLMFFAGSGGGGRGVY